MPAAVPASGARRKPGVPASAQGCRLRRRPGIVPTQDVALALDVTVRNLEADAVAAGAAGLDLVEQLFELGLAGHRVVLALEPVAQHVGEPPARQARARPRARAASLRPRMSEAATSASSREALAALRAERAKVSRNCGSVAASAGSSCSRIRLRV